MISKKNYIFSRSWVGPILSFFFIPVIWRNISSLTSLQYNKDHELAASINDNRHQFGVVEPPDGLTLGHSNKVGLGLPVHQPGFLSFCIFGVLKTALQVGNYCITINIQLESLPGKLIWSLYKSCWRWPSSARIWIFAHSEDTESYRKEIWGRNSTQWVWHLSLHTDLAAGVRRIRNQ